MKISLCRRKYSGTLNNYFNSNLIGFVRRFGFAFVLLINVHLLLLSQNTYTSVQSGNWATTSTWTGATGTPGASDTVIIQDGHTVSIATGSGESIYSITIEAGGVLDMQNKTFSVSGPFIVDGTLTSDDISAKDLDFDGDTLGGTGTIAVNDDSKHFDIAADVVVLPTTHLHIFANINIQNGVTVTNNGHLEIYGDLDGANATGSVWTNDSGSGIEVSGVLMTTGVLNASATSNTVTYIQQGDQSVKTPSTSTYYNLVISGTDTKTIGGDLIIENDLSIEYGSLNCNGNNLQIGGNWTNKGDFLESTGTVTFDGTTDQTIENGAGEIFYDLTVNKSSGLLILQGNVQAANGLNLTAGVVDAGGSTLTLGSGLASTGTLTYASGHINGYFERWVNSTGTFTFPVGSSSNRQSIDLTLSGLQTGGSLISKFYDSDAGNLGLPLFDNPDSVFNEFVDGYWSMDEGNGFNLGGANNYNLSLDGNGFSSFTIDGSTRVLTRSDAGSSWTAEGTHLAPAGSVARRSGLNTLPAEYVFGDTTNCSRPSTSVITGLTEVCSGAPAVSYAVTDNSPNSYTWYITGGTQVSGGNTNSITVDWGAVGMAGGNVRVFEYNTCSHGVPVDLPVTIHSIQPTSVTGRITVAENTNGEPYSVTNISGYTYTWTITGGSQASGGTSNSITVDWGSSGTGYVSVVAQNAGCVAAPATQIEVNKYVIIESIASGDWSSTATWDCGCIPLRTEHVRINNTHTVTLTEGGAGTEVNNFIIEIGGVLDPNDKDMTIHGNFDLNGSYLVGIKDLTMDGFGKYIDGVGTLHQGILLSSDVYFKTTAVLDITSGDLDVGAGVSISNYGSLTLSDNLVGLSAASTWVNETSATLKVGADLFNGNGVLDASSTGNSVYYYGTGEQPVKSPQSSYYNLITEGSGAKSMAGSLDVNGDLTIDGASVLDASTFSINLEGDWINLGGAFDEQSSTVILDGTTDQNITGVDTFYNLTFNNTSDLYLNNNVAAANNLSMNGGNIYTQGNVLTIGTGAGSPGSLTYASGIVVGQLERWATATASPYLFPIGTAADYRPATVTFTNIGTGSVLSEFIDSDPGSTGLPLSEGSVNITDQYTEGYWSLSATNGFTSTDYNVQLTATNFSSYTIIPGTRIIKRPAGGSWVLDGTHAAASSPDLYRNNLTGGISATGSHFGIGHFVCSELSIDRIITDVSCFGGNDGAIDITVNGGTAPYTFAWGHGPTSEDVSTLVPGNYSVNVTDTDGCEIDSVFTVTEPALLNATLNSVSVTCTGGNDGSITLSSPGGGSGFYDYTIDGGTGWQASGSFTNLIAGTYDVRIRDALATTCIVTLNGAVVLTEPNDAIPPVAVCRDITVQLDVAGNATITTLDIDNGSSDNCGIASITLDITSFTCADVGANTVTLTVLDGSGNSDNCTATVTVEDNIAPAITGCPANINTVADTSYCGVEVSWTAPTASDNCPGVVLTSTHNPGDIFLVGTTTVTYTATDACGLTDLCTFDVIVGAVTPPVINGLTSVCTPIQETYSVTDPGSHTFLWTVTNGTISGSDTNPSVTIDWTGTTQGIVDVTITSGSGCTNSNNLTVDKHATPTMGNINSSNSLTRR